MNNITAEKESTQQLLAEQGLVHLKSTLFHLLYINDFPIIFEDYYSYKLKSLQDFYNLIRKLFSEEAFGNVSSKLFKQIIDSIVKALIKISEHYRAAYFYYNKISHQEAKEILDELIHINQRIFKLLEMGIESYENKYLLELDKEENRVREVSSSIDATVKSRHDYHNLSKEKEMLQRELKELTYSTIEELSNNESLLNKFKSELFPTIVNKEANVYFDKFKAYISRNGNFLKKGEMELSNGSIPWKTSLNILNKIISEESNDLYCRARAHYLVNKSTDKNFSQRKSCRYFHVATDTSLSDSDKDLFDIFVRFL